MENIEDRKKKLEWVCNALEGGYFTLHKGCVRVNSVQIEDAHPLKDDDTVFLQLITGTRFTLPLDVAVELVEKKGQIVDIDRGDMGIYTYGFGYEVPPLIMGAYEASETNIGEYSAFNEKLERLDKERLTDLVKNQQELIKNLYNSYQKQLDYWIQMCKPMVNLRENGGNNNLLEKSPEK